MKFIHAVLIHLYFSHLRLEHFLKEKPGYGILGSISSFFFPLLKFNLVEASAFIQGTIPVLQITGLMLGLYIGFLTVKVKQKESRNLDEIFKKKEINE